MACETQGSGPKYFKVWTKSGEVLEYGNTDKSRNQVGDDVVVFALNKLSDTAGNYFTVDYYQKHTVNNDFYDSDLNITTIIPDEYEQRPVRIEYTGNDAASLTPKQYIEFVYDENVANGTSVRIGNDFMITNDRLIRLEVGEISSGADIERKNYQFVYTTDDQKPPFMEEIKECFMGDLSAEYCLPSTAFTWDDHKEIYNLKRLYLLAQKIQRLITLLTLMVMA